MEEEEGGRKEKDGPAFFPALVFPPVVAGLETVLRGELLVRATVELDEDERGWVNRVGFADLESAQVGWGWEVGGGGWLTLLRVED